MEIEKIIAKIRQIEETNDQSVLFTLCEDGSGSFEDFWDNTEIICFDNQEELAKILNECSSVAEVKEKSSCPYCNSKLGTFKTIRDVVLCCKCYEPR